MKKIIAVVIALVLTLSLAAAASADVVYRTLDEIKASGTINIGVFSDKTPSVMWMKTANIRAMMSTLPDASPRISVWN